MASVKWLTRIVVSDYPFRGCFQTVDYSYWDREFGVAVRVPITEMKVKAQIARPALHEVIPAASTYRVIGAAWTGDSQVTNVEVSRDQGRTYSPARFLTDATPHAWRLWEYVWRTPPTSGRYALMARARDAKGREQPAERDPYLGN
jgi:Mo-co oxidoreductase dimerisation domain